MFSNVSGSEGKTYISETVNLKFIPDKVSLSQYITVLIKSPDYLLKFWNSVILVVPIVLLQLGVASITAYGFTRWRGKVRSFLFFFYVILMLMPVQVTLVPNYLVSDWLNLLNTRWSIIFPGAFAPFSVFLLTKSMRRIPASLIEAAKLDGSSEWQVFKDICLPQCRSALYSLERVPLHHQFQRGGPGLCHRHHLYGALAAAVPPRGGLSGGGHCPPGLREGLGEAFLFQKKGRPPPHRSRKLQAAAVKSISAPETLLKG